MVPPQPRHNPAHRIRNHVPNIPHTHVEPTRPNPFAHDRPHRPVQQHLGPRWDHVMFAQSQHPLNPQHHRQGRRDEEQVVEVIVQERRGNQWFQHPSIECVSPGREKKQWIPPIAETAHNSASITKPAPNASRTFRIITIPGHYNPAPAPAKQLFLATAPAPPIPLFAPLKKRRLNSSVQPPLICEFRLRSFDYCTSLTIYTLVPLVLAGMTLVVKTSVAVTAEPSLVQVFSAAAAFGELSTW